MPAAGSGYVPINTDLYEFMPTNLYKWLHHLQTYNYDFTVIMKDGSIIKAKSKIGYLDSSSLCIIHKQGKIEYRIKPIDTKQLNYINGKDELIVGIPNDSSWLFKTETGRINVYSYLPDLYTAYMVAIQNGNEGPIVVLSKENLRPLISTNSKALELLEKGNLVRVIRFYNKLK